MAKLIKLSADRRIEFLCTYIFIQGISPAEVSMLTQFIKSGGNISAASDVVKAIREAIGMNESTFNVSLSRMIKKGFVKKQDGLLITHPVFLDTQMEYVVRFS